MAKKINKGSLSRLILSSLEGKASPEQMESMFKLLENSSEARKYYYDYLTVFTKLKNGDALLKYEADNSSDIEQDINLWLELASWEKKAPCLRRGVRDETQEIKKTACKIPAAPRKIEGRGKRIFWLAVAGLLFLVSMIAVENYVRTSGNSGQIRNFQDSAVVKDVINFGPNSENELEKGKKIFPSDGLFKIQSGIIKLSFDKGTQAVIESPANFKLLKEGNIELKRGSFYAKVPERAIGFQVFTPNSKIVDLGTEFGIFVDDDDDSTELHVKKGRTNFYPKNENEEYSSVLEVKEGDACTQVADMWTQWIDLKKNFFTEDFSSDKGVIYRGNKVIEVGKWQRRTLKSLEDGFNVEGKIIKAENFGKDAVSVNTKGLSFVADRSFYSNKATRISQTQEIPAGSNEFSNNLFYSYLDIKAASGRRVMIKINNLVPEKRYKISLIVGLEDKWSGINFYGVNREYMWWFSSDPNNYGVASFEWKAHREDAEIMILASKDKYTKSRLFGYFLEEIEATEGE
ncbi:FecR domain-containing protein [Sedimentisphaera salicampi]|uniref:FecR protein n=1 Tax=Sedimentisphaera salicampi TaxID=1941349 RepID=A0A1W6LNW3_9BACT|nr:FecR domain-containing protein [Sedimentisphaera salicampi]ARN57480.1 FecR protein [Sedimentisphaera salicampi]